MEEQKLSVKTNLAYQHYRFLIHFTVLPLSVHVLSFVHVLASLLFRSSLAKTTFTAWCFYVEDNKVLRVRTTFVMMYSTKTGFEMV